MNTTQLRSKSSVRISILVVSALTLIIALAAHTYASAFSPPEEFDYDRGALGSNFGYPGDTPLARDYLFVSNRDGNYEIYVRDEITEEETRLTTNSTNDFYPRLSPDGTKIVFTCAPNGNQDICIMNSDGSNIVRLTTGTAQDWWPSFSPDGNHIAFSSERDGNREIYTMNVDGTDQTNRSNHGGEDDNADWGSNGKIAFASRRTTPETEIWVMDANGDGKDRLTFNPSADYAPAWSPDASRVAFLRGGGTAAEVYNMAADKSEEIRVTDNSIADGGPLVWSPPSFSESRILFARGGGDATELWSAKADGTSESRLTLNDSQDTPGGWDFRVLERVVFTSGRHGNTEIYVMNSDGTNETRLTTNVFNDDTPVWSPDGTKIAFVSHRDGHFDIYLMDAIDIDGDGNGDNLVRLTVDPSDDLRPAFSPDGSRIAFDSKRDGDWDIYVMDPVDRDGDGMGDNLDQLTTDPAQDVNPAWAPHGLQIAFMSDRNGASDQEIYVMDADGSNQDNLTNTGGNDTSPDWSPDAKKIAFRSNRSGHAEIMTMDADGSNQTRLTFSGNASDPVWSLDSTSIVFADDPDGLNIYIHVMDADGANKTRLTPNPDLNYNPDWGPPRSRSRGKVAFQTNRDGDNEIFVMDANGLNQIQCTFNSADDIAPAWSPDGRRIAFTSNRDGNYEIYLMNADGSNPQNLTGDASDDYEPSWSPDGKRIAFASNRNGNYGIYVMDVDEEGNSSNQTQVTFPQIDDSYAAWSPDGTRIAFMRHVGGRNWDIYTIDPDDTEAEPFQLTNKPSYDSSPAWSPDSSRIAFHSDRDSGEDFLFDIFTMDADTEENDDGDVTTIVKDADQDAVPDWGPDGILFQAKRDGNYDIYLVDPETKVVSRLTSDAGTDYYPDWKPLAGRIVFYRDIGGGNNDIYIINAGGGNEVRLTNSPLSESIPLISPDGRRIIFEIADGGNDDIYVMDSIDLDDDGNGDNRNRLTDHPTRDTPSGWSPDGSDIVFYSLRHGNFEIYVMDGIDGAKVIERITDNGAHDDKGDWHPNPVRNTIVFNSNRGNADINDHDLYEIDIDTKSATLLIDSPDTDEQAKWSPDGTKIAFTSNRTGNKEIYVRVLGTGYDERLTFTENNANSDHPSWSPDGSRITFASNRFGDGDIFMMDADGAHVVRLTDNNLGETYPDWGPSPIPSGESISGEGFILSRNADFSTNDRVFVPTDTLHILAFSQFLDFSSLNKINFKVERSKDQKAVGQLTNNLDGTYTTSVSLSDFKFTPGGGKVQISLEVDKQNKFGVKTTVTVQDDIPSTSTLDESFILSRNADFSTNDRVFAPTDTVHILLVSEFLDFNSLKRFDFKVERSKDQKAEGNLTNNLDGRYTTSVSLSDFNFTPGSGKVHLKLEVDKQHKFEVKRTIAIQ